MPRSTLISQQPLAYQRAITQYFKRHGEVIAHYFQVVSFSPQFSFRLFLSQDFKSRGKCLHENTRISSTEYSWITQLELVHFPNFYLCIHTHHECMATPCYSHLIFHENKIPKNPISWQPHISDSNIYQPAEPHSISYKLQALQICICTPESEGL